MKNAIHGRALALFLPILFFAGVVHAEVPLIRLAHAPHDHHAALYVAAANSDIFKNQGAPYLREKIRKKEYELVEDNKVLATVTIDSSTGGSEIIRKLAEDQFDIAFGGFPPMVQAIDDGKPIRVIAPVMTGGSGLIVGRDHGVTNWTEFIQLAKKENGRQLRIGHQAAGSVQSLSLMRALGKEGITSSQSLEDEKARVILVDLHGPRNLLPSLKGRVVDGFIAMQPYVAEAQSEKLGSLAAILEDFQDDDGPGLYPCCALAARNTFINNEPKLAEKLLGIMMRANAYLAENPREAAKAVANWLGEKPEVEEVSLPTIRFITDFDDQWRRGVNQWLKEMVASGMLKGKVKDAVEKGNQEEVIYNSSILRKVAPKR